MEVIIPKFYIAGRILRDEEIAEHTRPLAICQICKHVLCRCGACHSLICQEPHTTQKEEKQSA